MLHNILELFEGDLGVAILIRLLDHLVDLFVGHVLAQLLSHALQIFKLDETLLTIVKNPETL